MSGGGFVGEIFSRYASTFLFAYDIMLTLNEEANLVWQSAWGVPKGIYFFIRYFGLAASMYDLFSNLNPLSNTTTLSDAQLLLRNCYKYNWFNSTWLLVAAGLADLLLLLRVVAILGSGRPRMCRFLKCIYAVTYSIEFALLVYSLATSTAALTPESYIDNLGCVTTDLYYIGVTSLNMGNLSVPIAASLVLILNLILLLVAVSHLAHYANASSIVQPPLIVCLLRDGVASFLILSLTAGFCIVTPIVFFNRPGLELMSLPWFLALSPIAACTIFRNLRAAARKPSSEDTLVYQHDISSGSSGLESLPRNGGRRLVSESRDEEAVIELCEFVPSRRFEYLPE